MSDDRRTSGVNVASIREFVLGVQAKQAEGTRDALKAGAIGATAYLALRATRKNRGK